MNEIYGVILFSGGKDSTYAMLLAHKIGIKLKALLHFTPKNNELETDSYMYQSAGSRIVKNMLKTTLDNIEIITSELKGSSIATNSINYVPTKGDEVEDLYNALYSLTNLYKEIKVVISGALFSTYQTKRVENCCKRLDLISLAPLYGVNQLILLDSLYSYRDLMKIKIIKTATLGLKKEHIMNDLSQIIETLLECYKKYQINVCGEGGEYESLCISCPLYKYNIDFNYEIYEDKEVNYIICPTNVSIDYQKNHNYGKKVELYLPYMHTLIPEMPSVEAAAILTIKYMINQHKYDKYANVDYELNNDTNAILFNTINSYVQYPSHNCLLEVRMQQTYNKDKGYKLCQFRSVEPTILGYLHTLVQLRNFISFSFDEMSYIEIFTQCLCLSIYTNNYTIPKEVLYYYTHRFQSINFFWSYNNKLALYGSFKDKFVNELMHYKTMSTYLANIEHKKLLIENNFDTNINYEDILDKYKSNINLWEIKIERCRNTINWSIHLSIEELELKLNTTGVYFENK